MLLVEDTTFSKGSPERQRATSTVRLGGCMPALEPMRM